MICIAICNERVVQRRTLRNLVCAWAKERGESVRLACYVSDEHFFEVWQKKMHFDILISEIKTNQTDGLVLARRIRQTDNELLLLFVVETEALAMQAYEVQAFACLMKPVVSVQFSECIDRAVQHIARNTALFTFTANGKCYRIPMQDIMYFEVQGHYVTLYTQQEAIRFPCAINRLEKMLPEAFLRIQRSIVVNIDWVHVACYGNVVLRNAAKTTLSIGRGWRNTTKAAIMNINK